MTSRFHKALPVVLLALPLSSLMTAQAQTLPEPKLVTTQFKTADFLIATVIVTQAPFQAIADGHTDCTRAIQSAIDAVSAAGGGVVYLPAGRYRCETNLVLKEGVTLRGDWKAPTGTSAKIQGTVLMPLAGRGQADGNPFISMYRGTGIRNLSIWYPDQTASHIAAYPWTISSDTAHSGNNFTVTQVTLVNPYQAMKFGPEYNEMFTIRNVYGTPLKTGIWADSITDIGRIISVKFGPRYWSESGLGAQPDRKALAANLRDNATGIEMLRSDWQYIYDVDLQGYQYGLHFRQGAHGATLGVLYGATATGGRVGLLADEVSNDLLMTNCRFDGSTAGVQATTAFADDLELNNCRLGSSTAPHAVALYGNGTIRLQNCTIASQAKEAAITAHQGTINLLNCDFQGVKRAIHLAAKVQRSLILGCRTNVGKTVTVENKSHGDVQVDARPINSVRPNIPPIAETPDPRPATNRLFNVLDYGAKSDGYQTSAFDNTAAFQKALNTAGAAHGGTVYVPAGQYRFEGVLKVPTGVELRGCCDVPHHTISMGSMLFPTAGRGQESGTPFISLASGSGARGLTVWYPEQTTDRIVPYPWTVRAMGPKCWLMDFTAANPYQLADFGSYPSEGHLLRYVAGSPLRRGIWVSKGSGLVDSCHFNMHEWLRRSSKEPELTSTPGVDSGDLVFAYQAQNLMAFTFGNCPHEVQLNNFVYGCAQGLRLVADAGKGTSGSVINHASDGSSTGVTINDCSPNGVQIVNMEVATVGKFKHTALEIDPACRGVATFFGGVSFGQNDVPALLLHGKGQTVIQGWKTSQREAHVSGGSVVLQGLLLEQPLLKSVVIDGPIRKLELTGNAAGSDRAFTYDMAKTVSLRGNGRTIAPTPLVDRFSSNTVHSTIMPIGVSKTENAACVAQSNVGPNGQPGFVLSGTDEAGAHTIAYYSLYDLNLPVTPNTVLRYWLRPETAASTHTGVDVIFTDGSVMRDMGLHDTYGRGLHPAAPKGMAGMWTKVECKIGEFVSGKTIQRLVFAYDQTGSNSPFRASAANIEIGEPKTE